MILQSFFSTEFHTITYSFDMVRHATIALATFFSIMFILGIANIAMIVVGSLYLNECMYSNAALFLIISGTAGCITCIIAVFWTLFKIDSFKYLSITAFIIILAITIWGSVEVFGKFLDYI